MIKILAVDDEPGICDVIQKAFTYSGFTVFTATRAEDALSVLEKEKPRIVFLDVLMPDVNGLDLLKKMKEIDPSLIVIMVTVKQDDETRSKAIDLGADEFVTKPFRHSYLRDVVVEKIQPLLEKESKG